MFNTRITDLSYVDNEAFIAGSIENLQQMVTIHEKWSAYASLKYDPKKCSLMAEEHFDHSFFTPDHTITINGEPVQEIKQDHEFTYLGIIQNFGRPSGSGGRMEGEKATYLQDMIATIKSYHKLHAPKTN